MISQYSIAGYIGSYYDNLVITFTPNLWYHLAFVGDGNLIKFYIDGVYLGDTNHTFGLYLVSYLRLMEISHLVVLHQYLQGILTKFEYGIQFGQLLIF